MKKVEVMGMALPSVGTTLEGSLTHCFTCGARYYTAWVGCGVWVLLLPRSSDSCRSAPGGGHAGEDEVMPGVVVVVGGGGVLGASALSGAGGRLAHMRGKRCASGHRNTGGGPITADAYLPSLPSLPAGAKSLSTC